MGEPRPVLRSGGPWWLVAALLAGLAIAWFSRPLWTPASSEAEADAAPDAPVVTSPARPAPPRPGGDGRSAASAGDEVLLRRAIEDERSDVWVEFEATVTRLLPDDAETPRHQRFLVRTDEGDPILVAHNIDVAERAPVRVADRIRLRGEFEWNERGGVLHWTHRDASRGEARGWIEVAGRRFE